MYMVTSVESVFSAAHALALNAGGSTHSNASAEQTSSVRSVGA